MIPGDDGKPYNEADTRAKLIDPKIRTLGWIEDLIRREKTAGTIEIINGNTKRKTGKMDYLLCLPVKNGENPLAIAILEAKKEDEHASVGIEQAKDYAKYQNVPFVFSTNGHLFVKYDIYSGIVSEAESLEHFPKPETLRQMYEEKKGFSIDSDEAEALLVPYIGGQSERRYYQDAAIRATLEKIAAKQLGWNRVLLSLATGSGKTRIAVQLLHKLAASKHMKKALFVCDRRELRKQGFGKLFSVFGDDVAMIKDHNPQKNARIIVATYQSLGLDEEGDASFFLKNYPKNYFSHIIIDECHRSAWNKWSLVLTNNTDAVQIGLTATPRKIEGEESFEKGLDEEISRNNIKYFGEPVYEYPYSRGWEDGYLAACEIVKKKASIDERKISREDLIKKGVYNAKTGEKMTANELKETYSKIDYDNQLIIPERKEAMCIDLFKQLEESGDVKQKSIIFCANDKHAEDVAIKLNNLYVERGFNPCEKFAFKCTQKGIAGGSLGESQEELLENMRGSKKSHFIATTVDLLSTGVDIPCIQNIVFFTYIKSPIQFYQMVGRGMRIDDGFDKYMFRIYDYTNATRLFGKEFISKTKQQIKVKSKKRKIAKVHGYEVEIKDEGLFILMKDEETGKEKPVTVEEYKEKLAASLVIQVENIDLLREMWINPDDRSHLIKALPGGEEGAFLLRHVLDLENCDLFDVFAEVGFGVSAKTREERVHAFRYKNYDWLMSLPSDSSKVIVALANQFQVNGIEEIENPNVFDVPEIRRAGGLNALEELGEAIADLIVDVKKRLLVV